MANRNHYALLQAGVATWNAWRAAHPRIRPKLDGANLTGADLVDINLKGASLRAVCLRNACLDDADLSKMTLNDGRTYNVDLTDSDLADASLKRVNFFDAFLDRVSFRRADLSGASFDNVSLADSIFDGAILKDCSFYGAWLSGVSFGDVDLSEAADLEFASHYAPSSLGIDTVIRSKGRIPETFLRGLGLPDYVIRAIPKLAHPGNPGYARCFISYSHQDATFAEHLHGSLQAEGIRCWLDKNDILAGEEILRAIHRGIQRGDRLLLCCSSASLQSWWVQREVDFALDKERSLQTHRASARSVLIPLALDDSLFNSKDPIATLLRQRMAIDFRNGLDGFQAGFARLLRALSSRPSAAGVKTEPSPQSL